MINYKWKKKVKYQNFKISVSHTTRKPRANEIDGVDYFFIDKETFKKKIKDEEFYEHANIFGNYYGTSKKSINELRMNYIASKDKNDDPESEKKEDSDNEKEDK